MKKLLILVSLFFSFTLFSQNKQLLKGDSMVWYGLDFTKAKFCGDFAVEAGFDMSTGNEVIEKYMPGWNGIILKEPLRFDIGAAVNKIIVYYDVASVNKLNSALTKADSVYYDRKEPYKFKDPDKTIQEMVSKYQSDKFKNGLGISFIVESYNKKTSEAYVYFVLFDVENRRVISYKRLKGFPSGIGLKNYWSGAIKDIIKQCGSAYKSMEYQALKREKK